MSDGQPVTDPPDDGLIGREIGHYKIISELGRGGMATVYLAQQVNMKRQVAVKVLPREFLHDPQFIKRFKREVQLIAELEHPHILPVYDFGEHDRIPYIVMRYLAGGSLLDTLKTGLPPLADLARPLQQICSALDFAHAEGIIHRDIKPSNIMLDERGNAYLSDFGIAQIMQDAGRLTGSAVIGTPAYMSPEQAEARPLDARSDVYALGVVLFELVTGREPYQADTPMAMLLKQITEPMPSPRLYRPDLPPAVEAVILRATLKDPTGRYPAASDFAAAYRDALRDLNPEESAVRLPRPPAVEQTVLPGAHHAAFDTGPDLVDENQPTFVDSGPATELPEADVIGRPVETQTPTEAHANGETAPMTGQRWGPRPLWLALVAVAALVIVVGVLLSGVLSPGAGPDVPPTPFDGAALYSAPASPVQLAVPEDWQQGALTGEAADTLLWHPADEGAFVALRVYPAAEDVDDRAAADEAAFDDDGLFVPLGREDQPDGTLRVSYRVPQPDTLYEAFGGGQLDLFYGRVNEYDVVLEIFTRDDADPALLPALQQVLNSVAVVGGESAG